MGKGYKDSSRASYCGNFIIAMNRTAFWALFWLVSVGKICEKSNRAFYCGKSFIVAIRIAFGVLFLNVSVGNQ